MDASVKDFLKQKHAELHDTLVDMQWGEVKEGDRNAKLFSYKLGQYDILTEICHRADIHESFEYEKKPRSRKMFCYWIKVHH